MIDKATMYFKKMQIKNRQRYIDKTFKKDGLTDEVLEKQVEVNRLRHEYNIPDESMKVYEEYSQ